MTLAQVEWMAVALFTAFVLSVLGLSFYLGRRARSAQGYFAAGGQIHWAVNGISFAGDYLSAASFLGICGLIAVAGYDGFLYSIGYLAGWIVALFVVAEPMKRLGKYTFTDALDSTFNSRGIQLAAAVSTLIVSVFYLIPQMVGAGVLVEPLLGLDHHWGVIMVGAIVIFIVATAGMASTTYVQFLKGGLLIVFSTILVIAVLGEGVSTEPDQSGSVPHYTYRTIDAVRADDEIRPAPEAARTHQLTYLGQEDVSMVRTGEAGMTFVKLAERIPLTHDTDEGWMVDVKGRTIHLTVQREALDLLARHEGDRHTENIGGLSFRKDGNSLSVNVVGWWKAKTDGNAVSLVEVQSVTTYPDKSKWVDGLPVTDRNMDENTLRQVGGLSRIGGGYDPNTDGDGVGPFRFLSLLSAPDTVIDLPKEAKFDHGKNDVTVYFAKPTPGTEVMRPGQKFKIEGTWLQKVDFASLMLALFFGTAALPHVLIRYYTVPSPACARKSTIVAIAAIGFFYVLTMYMGLGSLVNEAVNPESNNMSAPLLARSFSLLLFAIISAIAFATVLGTVSGLIVASSGAVAHDLMDRFFSLKMTEKQKVYAGKLAAFSIGLVAIILGIVFEGMNVAFLVGWAFAVAASANLPAILMLLFWKKTTAHGIMASILVGILASVGIILMSPSMFAKYYGVSRAQALDFAWVPFDNPGIVSIPLAFITLVIVSLLTQEHSEQADVAEEVLGE
jgi:cation/acetate symporter